MCTGCASAHGYGQQPQSERLQFVDIVPIVPGPYELGVWEEMQRCLNIRADITQIRLGIAGQILDLDNAALLWGVYAFVNWPEGSQPSIVVDAGARYSARIWSHEMIHAIGGYPDGDYHLDICVLRDGPHALPVRAAPPANGTP